MEPSRSQSPRRVRRLRLSPWMATLAVAALLSHARIEAAPLTSGLITVEPGVALHVIQGGPESGRPALVLLPGWGMPAEVWQAQAETFASDRRVLAIAPRSQGRSTMTPAGLTPEQRARDLDKVLEIANVKSAVVVGWSQAVQDLGAYVAAFGTSRLAGIVFVDGALSRGWPAEVASQERPGSQIHLGQIFLSNPEAYAEGMIEAIVRTRPMPPVAETMRRSVASTPPALGYSAMLGSLFGKDRTSVLEQIDHPLLVLASDAAANLERQREQAERVKDGTFVVLQGAGHAVFVDRPADFARHLRRFLERIDNR
jgi:non-heme chloroperoxidase